jgi:hypothetical protein
LSFALSIAVDNFPVKKMEQMLWGCHWHCLKNGNCIILKFKSGKKLVSEVQSQAKISVRSFCEAWLTSVPWKEERALHQD